MKIKNTKQMEAEVARMKAEQALDRKMSNDISCFVDENTIAADDGTRTATLPDGECVAVAFDSLARYHNLYANRQEETFIRPLVAKNAKVFRGDDLRDNPYLNNVKLEQDVSGKFRLEWGYYQAYQLLNYDTPHWVEGRYLTVPALAYFDADFVFPYFIEHASDAWMSITPNEIFTMRQPIAHAKGKVVTLGCGMGYYAYMAARKPEVERVTIVEIADDAIKLFKDNILPHFEHPEKVEVIQADAYAFMETLEDGVFDYCFADTWIGANSVSEYLTMRQACSHLRKTKVEYWIEDSFLRGLIRLAAYEVSDAFDAAQGRTPAKRAIHNDLKRAQIYMSKLLENTVIPTPASLQRLLSRKGILDLMDKSDVDFSQCR